jgi:anti-anti-sigma factor
MDLSTVHILEPAGALDGENTNELRRQILDRLQSQTDLQFILLDMKGVTFMNSSAVGALVATKKAVQEAGKQIFVCSLTDQVRLIFELTKMDQVFKPLADRQAFEEKIQGST